MKIEIFKPIESMNPIYLGAAENELYQKILQEHNSRTFAEIKEDGYRMQVHKKDDKIMAFTRSLNPIMLNLLPELNSSLSKLPDCILDSELIGDNKIGHIGFDVVKRRFRNRISEKGAKEYLKSGIVKELPIALRVFDTLYWEGKQILNLTLSERRKYTENIFQEKIKPSEKRDISNPNQLKNLFESLVEEKYEGLVCKNPQSIYLPGKKTEDWIKLKRSECLDLAVLGVYIDKNKISQILCGTYNPKKTCFETLAKVNAKREGMNNDLEGLLGKNFVKECPSNVLLNPLIYKQKQGIPDYFIFPEKTSVVEVAAMNFNRGKNWHSCGLDSEGKSYSLRIGWLKSIREDKSYLQIATPDFVKLLYEAEGADNKVSLIKHE
jgi:ATP-dependent DNA ligase